MNLKFRHYLVAGVALLSVLPGILISEPTKVAIVSDQKNPVEVLNNGFTIMNTGTSVLIKLDSDDASQLTSFCNDERNIVKNDDHTSVVEWTPKKGCRVPLVTYKNKNYLLPVRSIRVSRQALSDISSDTLRNTLNASQMLSMDFSIPGFDMKKFLTSIKEVLDARKQKFGYPIPGLSLPVKETYLPNASRPYRAGTTDAVHHGWDFYTKNGTPVRAIEDGIIIHTKRDFSWKEMDHLIEDGTELSEQENLDTYRGNTVYLKTVSGHVAIYAHLDNIPDQIQVGTEVKKGSIIGHVGDSAVPDKKYLYHLHFELAINPLIDTEAGKNTFEDVLLWPFWGQGKSFDWIRKNDDSLFE